jgi:hypothetical protein
VAVLPRALLWRRTDLAGAEHAVFDDRRGFTARGVAVAGGPVPYACRYELSTDGGWASRRFVATVEGAGWTRSVRMDRSDRGWRVTTAEEGDLSGTVSTAPPPGIEDPERLADAIDIDLFASPLTNTLPLRRLRLSLPGMTETVVAAWVLLPSLSVVANAQTYTVLAPGKVRYASGAFTADLAVDEEGYVIHYPGLAKR